MQTINIEAINQAKTQYGLKITIESQGKKYAFFDTKKDGTKTKAYEQYQKYGYQIGETVKAEVAEEKKKFTNDQGKTIDYTDRRIMYFEEVENVPVISKTPLTLESLDARVRALEGKKGLPNAKSIEDEEISMPF